MNPVPHKRKSDFFGIVFCCDLSKRRSAAVGNFPDQHRPSIFWRPDYMVFAEVDNVVV